MSEEGRKKISFGFSKKSTLQAPVKTVTKGAENDAKEYIDSLEGKQIKTLG
jgi:hypothetical protein